MSLNLYGKSFLTELKKKLPAKTTSYSNCLNVGAQAAAYPNKNSNTFIPFYHGAKDSEKTTIGNCNREHTWPNSRGGGQFDGDPIMVRPTLTKDNSSRGNNFYGIGTSQWDPALCGYEGARGEAARVILYCVVAWNHKGISLSNNPSDSTGAKTMGTLKTLLEWNTKYLPTQFELTVNQRYADLGYNRNPFVEHPEYANYIYDANGFRTTPYDGFTTLPDSSEQEPLGKIENPEAIIDGDYVIAAESSKTAGSYYMMTSNTKGETLPWYIVGEKAEIQESTLTSASSYPWFTFRDEGSNAYSIQAPDGRYLYGYVSGTHYSIGLGEDDAAIRSQQSSEITSLSKQWYLIQDNGGFQFRSGCNVYLEYYGTDASKESWCGYKSAPSKPLQLFA